MTPAEVEDIAEKAAKKAVSELMMMLGVDTNSPAAVLEAQKDFAFARAFRRSTEMAKGAGIKAGVTVLVTGLLGALWMIFKPGG